MVSFFSDLHIVAPQGCILSLYCFIVVASSEVLSLPSIIFRALLEYMLCYT